MTLISAVATSSHRYFIKETKVLSSVLKINTTLPCKFSEIFPLFSDLETLMPGFGLIEEDISNIRNGITQLSKALESGSISKLI
jgi:hypothetical protein